MLAIGMVLELPDWGNRYSGSDRIELHREAGSESAEKIDCIPTCKAGQKAPHSAWHMLQVEPGAGMGLALAKNRE